ncbi:putative C6 transcription factor [Talaromyces proteolyticus]|uniref:C6 transcription factor n=1 Tax=Talaromyces proteolyticus TaxID=1131652 RepID=A0AAD4KRZ5_9EURO|nr:putative C6 transcription factor [Talaromyces proteolyticus]KAH8697841.1 putative C6 transcription factor [Talaromyces proteolyticus]
MISSQPKAKSRRATRACDFCHKRGRRCKRENESSLQCATCIDYGVACTWSRVPAKRGTKPRYKSRVAAPWTLSESIHGPMTLIEILIDNFFESVYPVAITIHEQTFRERWNNRRMPDSRGSYSRLMAMCAVSALRIKNGSVLNERHVPSNLDPKLYFDEALQALPDDVNDFEEFESLQAIGLACLTALHYSDEPLLHQVLGLYHAVVAEQGFCDEKRWPRDLTGIEREERRRLFWHMYRLEVHTSLVIGHVIRCPELQSSVAYPTIQDNDLTKSDDGQFEWLSGWNFVTDLYRGIEHVISQFKYRRASTKLDDRYLSTSFILDYDPQKKILDPLAAARRGLPDRFMKAMPVSSNVRRNRCGYQTANIACTYQLLRMVTFSAYHTTTLDEACQTVLELIDEISNIPIEYLRAMGLAMLQELSGFGHILNSFITQGLSRSDYHHLRTVMLCMSELLESLSSCMTSAMEASQRLRAYVEDIDRFLTMPQIAKNGNTTTSIGNDGSQGNTNSLDLISQQLMVPLDVLQRIPWPAAWEDFVGLF